MTWIPDATAAKFGGMSSCVEYFEPTGGFMAVVYDLGPNIIAAGDGASPMEAIENLKKVVWGYRLRLDFLDSIPEQRRQRIGDWIATLTSEQRAMVCELMDAHLENHKRYA